MFNTRGQVELPTLRCDLAGSKPVKNMYELAHVASTALHPHWREERKENELLDDSSRYLSIHGLACAIYAQKRQAMARLPRLTTGNSDEMPYNPVLIALPKSFGKVLKEVKEPSTVKFLVYTHFGDLADQLNKTSKHDKHFRSIGLGMAKRNALRLAHDAGPERC
ncbi:hypothetical protein OESDEN_04672 [Oesophagostomum dentatum]|uniref:Uncharacterized protein n=1 Tax=Oesophagostomum dentatum TaxID=61180 RepID=A0A0B1TIY8_OESDE|nr:hypothetical protein OESDEN_04672 [Oesophagostomum dentatum]